MAVAYLRFGRYYGAIEIAGLSRTARDLLHFIRNSRPLVKQPPRSACDGENGWTEIHSVTASRTQPRARIIQPETIDAGLCREIKRLPVGIAPGHVVRMLRAAKCSKVFAVRRKNPQPAWAAYEDV